MALPAARVLAALLLAAGALALPTALAHGVGGGVDDGSVARFALPAWAVWVAGAAVVALSFLLVAASVTRPDNAPPRRTQTAAPEGAGAGPAAPRWARATQAAALALLVVACAPAIGAFETSLLPSAALWLVLWTIVPLVAYLSGDAWRALDPFAPLARLADRTRGARAAPLRMPVGAGAWPAVALLLAFIGLEVWSAGRLSATGLARVLLAYLLATFGGMLLFGGDAWRRQVEPFGRYYTTLAAASPVARDAAGRLRFRAPWAGLRDVDASGRGEVALLVAVLYGVNFDGFLATAPGRFALDRLSTSVPEPIAFVALLAAGFLVFLGVFLWTATAIRERSEALEPASALAARFAASLVPIAVAYHAAHNLPYLYANAPALVHALIDPLGLGWVGWLGLPVALPVSAAAADVVGALQLALIVGGHVLAVVAAHDLAVRGFPSLVQAFRSELPLTRVMVFYTLVGLWIVATATHAPVTGAGP